MSKFTPTPAEVALINQVFALADTQKLGVITGEAAVKIFSGSKLPPTVLAEVWNLADDENNGVLTRKGVGIALRLLGHAQRGEKLSEALVNKPGSLPNIEGLPPVSVLSGISPAKSPPPGFPPLPPHDKTKFLNLFLKCHPTNGLLSGDQARDVFVKSKLPVEKLSQIWNLADRKNRGVMDATDFTIGMYLIQASMSGQLPTIPASLPQSIIELATQGVAPQATGDSAHIKPSMTGSMTSRPVQPQYTGQALSHIQTQMTGQALSTLQPQFTDSFRASPAAPPLPARSAVSTPSGSTFPFVPQQNTGAQWDVTPQEKVNSDRLFDGLDPQKRGYIEGDVAVPFMLQSNLPEDVLAVVWDLADLNNDGHLTRDGFAVAMHLIQSRLNGKDIPKTIPLSLVPPSMRGKTSSQSPPTVPEPIKDLLWDDSPPPSATTPTHPSILQPQSTGVRSVTGGAHPMPARSPPPLAQTTAFADPFASAPFGTSRSSAPHKDLLGDDEEPHLRSPPLHDQSAEIGNVKNQLSSTNRSLETAKAERATLERQLADQAALLSSLQTQLSSSKAAYDTETKLLATLKERFAAQSADIQKTREELIRCESDLSAAKVEKAEVEGMLLRDKEEVRDLHRKMIEVGTQIETTKGDLDRFKKEAKQQKGLLAIAKKQLATRESEKAKVDKEMDEAKSELQQASNEREAAEAEAELSQEVPTGLTNGHSGVSHVSTPDPTLSFAADQPLPASLPTSPDMSPPAAKRTNPFERLAMSSSPRSESPFLPFAASSALPTPPSASSAPVISDSVGADPFGFDDAFSAPQEPKLEVSEPETPKPSIPHPISIGSPKQQELISPAETDFFTTPPSTATSPEHAITPEREEPSESRFPALDDIATADATPTASTPPSATFPGAFQSEDTNLTHRLKEIEESESDSSDEDTEPLTSVQARLADTPQKHTNGHATGSGTSAFDDSFGISDANAEEELKQPSPPASNAPATGAPDFTSMFNTPAVSKEAPPSMAIPAVAETPKLNGSATAGVSEFDQALSKLSGVESSAPSSHFNTSGFDSAFDDNFDFAAASAAQPTQQVVHAPATAATFPPAPTTVDRRSTSFDDVFGTNGTVTSAPTQLQATPTFPVPAPVQQFSQPISFDDAFGASTASTPQDLAASTSSPSNGMVGGLSFDDAFGGNDAALALDSSFTTQSSYQPPPGPPPAKAVQQPFPSSTASSPRGSTSTQTGGRRSSSPVARHASPPPRHLSPSPQHVTPRTRPAASGDTKEKPRTNRLSIRLPFGKRKKQSAPPPVPSLAQSSIPEDGVTPPVGDRTPAVEDDVDAVKTLCGMGFSRTQAVTALEEHAYDVQRALNSLLGSQ